MHFVGFSVLHRSLFSTISRMFPALYIFGILLLMLTRKAESITFKQSSPQIVKEGTKELTIDCSHDGSSLTVMLWYQQKQSSRSMSLIGFTVLYSEPNYERQFETRFQLKREDMMRGSLIIHTVNSSDSAVYYCAASAGQLYNSGYPAYFGAGTKLTVLEKNHTVTPPTVKVFKPHLKECSGSKDDQKNKTLVCVASGFYPDHVNVTWEVNGNDVRGNSSFGMTEDPNAVRDGNDYRITSRLRVPAAFWYANHTFTCIVTFFNGTGYEKHTESIFGEAKNGWKTEQLSRIFQTAKLSYGVFIIKSSIYGVFVTFLVWKLQGSAGKQN